MPKSKKGNVILDTLQSLIKMINRSLVLDEMLSDSLDAIMTLFHCDDSLIRLIDRQTDIHFIAAYKGLTTDQLAKFVKRRPPGEGFATLSMETGEVLAVEDLDTDHRYGIGRNGTARLIGVRSFVHMPLLGKNGLLGAVTMHYREPQHFSPDQIELFTTIGYLLGTAIENSQLYEINNIAALEKLRNNFFSMITHKLRTPLTTVKEGASLLLEGVGGSITKKQEQLLSIIAIECKRMANLLNSILNLNKMEAGMMTYSFENGKIDHLIEQVMAENAPNVEAKSIHLKKQISAGLPPVRMDHERILDVLRNLVENAVKFTPKGGRITIVARPVDGGLEVSVSDTGPGIAKENLVVIFEKFASFDQKNGIGLGLSIAKHIVEAHGGKVWAEAKVDEGATFHFSLPSPHTT
jgi:signal transduction histidine kinase